MLSVIVLTWCEGPPRHSWQKAISCIWSVASLFTCIIGGGICHDIKPHCTIKVFNLQQLSGRMSTVMSISYRDEMWHIKQGVCVARFIHIKWNAQISACVRTQCQSFCWAWFDAKNHTDTVVHTGSGGDVYF